MKVTERLVWAVLGVENREREGCHLTEWPDSVFTRAGDEEQRADAAGRFGATEQGGGQDVGDCPGQGQANERVIVGCAERGGTFAESAWQRAATELGGARNHRNDQQRSHDGGGDV